jgi:glycosyltransferase involved in cell wall biosynthesis
VFCRTLAQADTVVANSTMTAREVERICACATARVLWQGGTTGPEPLKVGDTVRVVTVGHIDHDKGVFEAASALAQCREQGVRLSWTIVGGGSDETVLALRRHISGLAMDDCTIYVGERPNEEVISLMQRSDVFLLPTRQDAYGVAFAEAAGAGCAVVGGEAAGAIRDFQSRGAPVVGVSADDVPRMVQALMDVMRDVPALDALKIRTQDWARGSLGWDRYCEQLEEVYTDARTAR